MSEELQRYLSRNGGQTRYCGEQLDRFEHYKLGSTTLQQLKGAGIIEGFATEIRFQPRIWPGGPSSANKPDELILDGKQVVAVVERKRQEELDSPRKEESAAEQCFVYLQQLDGRIGIITDSKKFLWIHNLDPTSNALRYIYDEGEPFQCDYQESGVLQHVLRALDPGTDAIIQETPVDPSSLADSVWQTIWHSTHENPKLCLATFVEIFLYKFLSNLDFLPSTMRIEQLDVEEQTFKQSHGVSQIEYYVNTVRPQMKTLFPEGMDVKPQIQGFVAGSQATSIIDNFAFSSNHPGNSSTPLDSYNHEFLQIIRTFVKFGRVNRIDTEFKSRVYEKFLKKDVTQQKLGQYLTPRNVVRAIIGMAQPKKLLQQPGAIICDPACGVGGFLLEPLIHRQHLEGNLIKKKHGVRWQVGLLGLEVDRQTNILSKANMLIHLADDYREFSETQKRAFVALMNNTFVLCDHDKMLGALEFPQEEIFDLVLTNPPFVVKGTKVIKEKIARKDSLRKCYAKSGMGIESLFLRFIVDSLKPGGRAFVVVPTGVLTRSETAVKEYLREYCVVDGIISLPERTFYNTPNPTYILCLTKRLHKEEQNAPVFAYLVREVGETRDALRFPCRSDLPDLVRQYRAFYADKEVFEPRNPSCKLIPIEQLRPGDRWDVDRFWTDEERSELGLDESQAVSVSEFESELNATMAAVQNEIEELREEAIQQPNYIEIRLGNKEYFEILRGHRVTRTDARNNPGPIPVISGRQERDDYIGYASKEWLEQRGIPIRHGDEELITVNANGSVGTTHLRTEEEYVVHDDVNLVRVLCEQLHKPYVVFAIREAVAKARFRYNAKLYKKRLRNLVIRVPIDANGQPDIEQQIALALQYERLEMLKDSILRFAGQLTNKFVAVEDAT